MKIWVLTHHRYADEPELLSAHTSPEKAMRNAEGRDPTLIQKWTEYHGYLDAKEAAVWLSNNTGQRWYQITPTELDTDIEVTRPHQHDWIPEEHSPHLQPCRGGCGAIRSTTNTGHTAMSKRPDYLHYADGPHRIWTPTQLDRA